MNIHNMDIIHYRSKLAVIFLITINFMALNIWTTFWNLVCSLCIIKSLLMMIDLADETKYILFDVMIIPDCYYSLTPDNKLQTYVKSF